MNTDKANSTDEIDVGRDLAQWLKEAGHRRSHHGQSGEATSFALGTSEEPQSRSKMDLALVGLLAATYLGYYFADVYLQIMSLPSNVFFIR